MGSVNCGARETYRCAFQQNKAMDGMKSCHQWKCKGDGAVWTDPKMVGAANKTKIEVTRGLQKTKIEVLNCIGALLLCWRGRLGACSCRCSFTGARRAHDARCTAGNG